MMILRFLGVIFAMIITFVLSMITKIDMISMVAMIGFILIVDNLICKFITYTYLKATYIEIEKVAQEVEEREKNGKDSSPE